MLDIGINNEDFYNNFFEKNIYFKKNTIAKGIIDWDRLNGILYGIDPTGPDMKVFANGVVPYNLYSNRYQDINALKYRLDKNKFDAYLRNGATLVLNRIDEKDRVLGALCMALSRFSGLKTVANAYVAFGGDGTFGKHWDTHDVFAVQLLGKKRWQIFAPTFELPLDFQKSKNFKSDCPDTPIFDQVLDTGDLLYIPRGWWHHAIPIPNQDTLHIAAGIHTAKTIDYLEWVAQEVLPSILASRRSLTSQSDHKKLIAEFSDALIQAMRDPIILSEFLEKMQYLSNFHDPVDLTQHKPDFVI